MHETESSNIQEQLSLHTGISPIEQVSFFATAFNRFEISESETPYGESSFVHHGDFLYTIAFNFYPR